LGQLAEAEVKAAESAIRTLARSETDEVRAQAVKLLGDHEIEEEFDLLLEALQDESARVRYFAAQSLGKLGRPEAAEALIELARENDDRDVNLRHAAVMGLTGTRNA